VRPSRQGSQPQGCPPSAIAIVVAKAMSTPAEMARLLTNAMVRMGVRSSASRIKTAASTRPPNVLISKTTADACCVAASFKVRSTNGARPRSMTPSMGMTYTTRAWAAAMATRLRPAIATSTRHSAKHRSSRRTRYAVTAPTTRDGRYRVVTIFPS
jgi:hypothetical protein